MSALVRVSDTTHKKLTDLAQATGAASMADVIEQGIELLRRKRLLEQVAADYAALRDDPAAWQAEQEERAAWDATLADGLADEEDA